MNQPDLRYNQEQEIYEHYKSLDYSKVTDWSILFSTHADFTNAVIRKNHPFHKEAMQIRENRKQQKKDCIPSEKRMYKLSDDKLNPNTLEICN